MHDLDARALHHAQRDAKARKVADTAAAAERLRAEDAERDRLATEQEWDRCKRLAGIDQ